MAHDYDKAFAKAIAKFNFKAAHAAMEAENWTWGDSDSVPDVDALIDWVVGLRSDMNLRRCKNISSGGFGIYTDDDDRSLTITFELIVTEYEEE